MAARRLALLGLVVLTGLVSLTLVRLGRRDTHGAMFDEATPRPTPSRAELEVAPSRVERSEVPAHEGQEDAREQPNAPPAEVRRVWRGRIVDGETWAPLEEASFTAVEGNPFVPDRGAEWASVKPGAFAEVSSPRWNDLVVLVNCPGYAMGFLAPRPGDSEPTEPEAVELWRAAAAEVRVEDGRVRGGDPVTMQILVDDSSLFAGNRRMSFGDEPVIWNGESRPDGVVVFEELPPRVELTLEARDGETLLHRESLWLQPGERRELACAVGDSSSIVGRALTPEGEPVAGLEIWLVQQTRLLNRYFEPHHDVQDRARTNEHGEFAFEDVAPGKWLVGPAAKDDGRDLELASEEAEVTSHTRGAIAPVPIVVSVDAGAGVVPVLLTCWSGLYIRGRVLDSTGRAASRASVAVMGPAAPFLGQVDGEGGFTAGPLVPGEYSLLALPFEGTDCPSDPVEARPGEEDVELRMKPGGVVSATVLDEEGRPAGGADVRLLSSLGKYEGHGAMETDEKGRIEFAGVPAGRYILIASRGNAIGVCANFTTDAGATRAGLELTLERAANVTLAKPDAPGLAWRVRSGGWIIDMGGFGGEREPSIDVPAGEVEVEVVRYRSLEDIEVLQRETVTLRAADSVRIELELESAPR